MEEAKAQIDLREIFSEINEAHFAGKLSMPHLFWNSRFRASAGRFTPCPRRRLGIDKPVIEVASYLLTEKTARDLVWDTVAHEMIHYWLWCRRRPYGHSGEFLTKMREMGVSRYNPVPRLNRKRYLYRCPQCSEEYPARRRLRASACTTCCKAHNGGYYDKRFRLQLVEVTTVRSI